MTSCGNKPAMTTIGYIQIAQDPSLDKAREGLLQALRDSGYIDGANFRFLDNNAQGDLSLIPTILQSLISRQVDIIVTNTTPCMIAAAQMVKEIPVVFTVSFSPQDMKVTTIPDNLYGIYDAYDVEPFVDLMLSLMPNLKKIGLPYNNAEPNAGFSSKCMIEELSKRGIDVVTVSVNSSNDILTAGNYLVDKNVEAIVVVADNIVNLGQALLAKIGAENNIPLFVTEPMQAAKGASIGYGVDYTDWGYEAGLKVIEILRNRPIAETEKIVPMKKKMLLINQKAAKSQGLSIPDSLLKKATILL